MGFDVFPSAADFLAADEIYAEVFESFGVVRAFEVSAARLLVKLFVAEDFVRLQKFFYYAGQRTFSFAKLVSIASEKRSRTTSATGTASV